MAAARAGGFLRAGKGAAEGALGRDFRALALHALDLNQVSKLAKAMNEARRAGRPLEPLAPFRLAVLSNATLEMIAPALTATAVRYSIGLDVVPPEYRQMAQEVLVADSTVNCSSPHAVLAGARIPRPAAKDIAGRD